ncbi:MAG: M23 family metallopeptidase [Clostridiales bacterium]|nr:M23 family metallopeptidase [Clostridiales bacterium]
MIKNDKTSFLGKLFSLKALYGVLAVIMLGVGVTAWYTAGRNIKTENPPSVNIAPTTGHKPQVQPATEPPERAGADVTGVPDERAEPATAEPTTAATVYAKPYEGYYSLPVGTDIGTDYSNGEMVYSATFEDWRTHNGIDFNGSSGDPVKAVSNGKVTAVYDDALWGTVVEIDHGEGMCARYCGLNKGSTPEKGAQVEINDVIGYLGLIPAEGLQGAHLHFEVRVNGKIDNPLKVLGRYSE